MTMQRLVLMTDRPFSVHPRPERYYPAAAIEEARQRLLHAVAWGSGPGLIIGGAGTGKSLLLCLLAKKFSDQFEVAHLSCAQICTRRALLQAILFELGLPYRSRDEGDLRISLIDHLLPNERCPNGMLLLVDEAHTLPVQLLEEIRLLTNLARGGTSRVRVVLAGSAVLEERFASPELESFSQRVAARCYLAPMNSHDTAQYVRSQLAAVGVEPGEIFGESAYGAIFEATDGVPRLVNQLCDRAIWQASEAGTRRIERQTIQEAWADLQQLPLPTEARRGEQAPMESIEFGSLADDEELVISATPAQQPMQHLASRPSARLDRDLDTAAGEEYLELDEIPLEQEWDTAVEDEAGELERSGVSAQPSAADSGELELEGEDFGLEVRAEVAPSSQPQCGLRVPAAREALPSNGKDALTQSRGTNGKFYISASSNADDSFEPLTINPFDESFDDEEIVLEDFAAIEQSYTSRTPQVANRREPSLAPMVTEALEACERRAAAASARDAAGKPRGFFSAAMERWGKSSADEDVISVEEESDGAGDGFSAEQKDFAGYELDETDIPGLDAEPAENASMTLRYPVLADSYDAAMKYTSSDDDSDGNEESGESFRDGEEADDDILVVVEDASAERSLPAPGAYRQEFRQLFARLRTQ